MSSTAPQDTYVTAPPLSCGGTTRSPGCTRSAAWVCVGHVCSNHDPESPFIFKCSMHHEELMRTLKDKFSGLSRWTCKGCDRTFASVEDFAEYERL